MAGGDGPGGGGLGGGGLGGGDGGGGDGLGGGLGGGSGGGGGGGDGSGGGGGGRAGPIRRMRIPTVQYTPLLVAAVQAVILPTLLASVVVTPACVTKRSARLP